MWLSQPEVGPGWRLDLAPPLRLGDLLGVSLSAGTSLGADATHFCAELRSSEQITPFGPVRMPPPDLARFGDTDVGLIGGPLPRWAARGRRNGGAGVRPVARRRRGSSDRQPQRRSGAVAGRVEAAVVVRRQPGRVLGRVGRVHINLEDDQVSLGQRHAHDRGQGVALSYLRCVRVPGRLALLASWAGRAVPGCGCESADRRCGAG
jgi:hypothetical protein